VCGEADSIVNLRAWHAEMRGRYAEGRGAAERRLAQPRTRPAADGGSGSGDADWAVDLGIEVGEELLLGLISLGLLAAWRKLVWNPLKYLGFQRSGASRTRLCGTTRLCRTDILTCGCARRMRLCSARAGKTAPARDASGSSPVAMTSR
jgi:hypothetical protein